MEIYGKIVPRWVIRSCCTPEDRAGAPPPFHPKCHCHHLLRSCQETAVRTRKFLLPTPHSAPGRPRRSHETGGTIHTSPFSWSCFGRTFPTTRDKRGQSWRDGRHCALLLLSAPFSSTCLGMFLPPAPPADFLPPQWCRQRCRVDARQIPSWSCHPFCLRALKPQKRWGGGGGPGAVTE